MLISWLISMDTVRRINLDPVAAAQGLYSPDKEYLENDDYKKVFLIIYSQGGIISSLIVVIVD